MNETKYPGPCVQTSIYPGDGRKLLKFRFGDHAKGYRIVVTEGERELYNQYRRNLKAVSEDFCAWLDSLVR